MKRKGSRTKTSNEDADEMNAHDTGLALEPHNRDWMTMIINMFDEAGDRWQQ